MLPDGSTRKLHANKLRLYISHVNALGIVFEDQKKDFGDIEFYDVSPTCNDIAAFEVKS